MDKSGATLAWSYFTDLGGKPLIADAQKRSEVERIFAYIEDHDLWNNKLPDTKEFSAGFAKMDYDLDAVHNVHLFRELADIRWFHFHFFFVNFFFV